MQARPLAPEHVGADRLPSPPMTTRLSMPASRSVRAAASRPSRVLNFSDRAVPMIVPPRWMMPPTEFHDIGRIAVAALDQAVEPLVDAEDLDPVVERRPHDGAHRRVHTRRVAAARQDADSLGGQRRAPYALRLTPRTPYASRRRAPHALCRPRPARQRRHRRCYRSFLFTPRRDAVNSIARSRTRATAGGSDVAE